MNLKEEFNKKIREKITHWGIQRNAFEFQDIEGRFDEDGRWKECSCSEFFLDNFFGNDII